MKNIHPQITFDFVLNIRLILIYLSEFNKTKKVNKDFLILSLTKKLKVIKYISFFNKNKSRTNKLNNTHVFILVDTVVVFTWLNKFR